ncbi:MAG: UDP-N-acetylglucosamine 2-epimerase (non-hydrolyzing) [Gammaproteobacteria bacterium TMED104]|nr:MAG: UDP-N-acetylglucosamine 2-epimerase (non-hydrolyzing) [Gammaproteobacteria bacterium TMED104]
MLKVLTVVGARPQFIKAAAVSRTIKAHNDSLLERKSTLIDEKIIHTGQHYDTNMSNIFFDELDIPSPDLNLSISNLSHSSMTAKMLEKLSELFLHERPDIVLLYGDTNSTLAGAMAAAQNKIPIAHVEAGLRSNNHLMPEEINRVVTDRLSSLLFCPTTLATNNLTNEGYPFRINDTKKQKIILSGDVMYDVLTYYQESASKINLINDIPLEDKNLITCTIHRESNTNDNDLLEGILDELIDLSKTFKIIFLVHPRLKKSKLISNKKFQDSNIILSDPLGYLEMQRLLMSSKFVITDSGGLQKEAYLHKIPCLTLRDETEWQETVTSGWNILTNPRDNKLVDALNSFKLDLNNYENFYGDGNASQKIVDGLIEYT